MAERQRRTPDDASGPVVLRPLVDFLHTEAAGGVVLLAATVVALLWANSPFKDSYTELWHTHVALTVGHHTLDLDLQEWVNDGLMAIFFFVVGPRDQARAGRGRAARAAPGGAAGHRRGRRHARAGPDLHGHQRRRRRRRRVGHPDGHRHRHGRRRAQPPRPPGRSVAEAVPARPRHRRRHRRHPRDRALLLGRHPPRRARAGRRHRGRRRAGAARSASGSSRCTCCSASASGWPSTSPASTPRWSASSSG